MNPEQITAVVLTKNEAANLPRALATLPRGCRTLVVDALSDDATRTVAQAHGARVVERAWTDFVDQRRFALGLVQTPWALMLDADEALDSDLCASIVAAQPGAGAPVGYLVRRVNHFRGRAIRGGGWANEKLLRLFRCESVHLEALPAAGGEAALHERWVAHGPTELLAGTLLHFSYPTYDAYRRKFRRYTTLEAAGLRGSRGALARAVTRAPVRFVWLYFARRGFLDGLHGALIAWYSACYPVVVRWKALRRQRT